MSEPHDDKRTATTNSMLLFHLRIRATFYGSDKQAAQKVAIERQKKTHKFHCCTIGFGIVYI